MPRDGSGNFIPIQNSWYPPINNTDALPDDWEAQFLDITSSIGASVAADGQKTMEGNLKMGNFQVTGLGSPSAEGNALRREQIQKGDDIPSAAALPIPLEGSLFDVIGTNTVTSLGASFVGREVWLRFTEALVLTNGPSMLLPDGVNITTAANDYAKFVHQSPGVWRCVFYPNGLYRRGNIRGTVSQSGGVPTGAVIERVSNASGIYVRFADGTQICYGTKAHDAIASASSAFSITLPAETVGNYAPNVISISGGSAAIKVGVENINSTLLSGFVHNTADARIITLCFSVIGRWYL